MSAVDDDPIVVTEQSVARKLREVSTSRASGPDDIPNWVLKEYADILAVPIAVILNASFSEVSVPRVWKLADVPPLPKAPIVSDFNKDLRPISLTSTMSKIAESFVIEKALKPVVLSHIDPGQFGFIPGSSTTFALISMFHHWQRAMYQKKKSLGLQTKPQKTLGPKFNPKKSHAEFPSHKKFQRSYAAGIRGNYHESSECLEYPQKIPA